MQVVGVTTPIVRVGDDLHLILQKNVISLEEKSILMITSKIVSLCEKSVLLPSEVPDKYALIAAESDEYTDPTGSQYGLSLTIRHGQLSLNAGVDESNSDGHIVLLPRNPQKTVNKIWYFLREKYQLKELGVVMIDSVPFPLKWGQTARSLAYCGFKGIADRTGELDLFGRKIAMTKMSMVEGLAAAAHLEMGEVAESRPIAIATQVRDIIFTSSPPSATELHANSISKIDDAFAPLLMSDQWKQGGGGAL